MDQQVKSFNNISKAFHHHDISGPQGALDDETMEYALPSECIPLDNQIAGHSFKTSPLGMLKEKGSGVILKYLSETDPRSARELAFYEKIFDPSNCDPVDLSLRKFLPQYLGILHVEGRRYLRLHNLTLGMPKASIADIKIGIQTWDDDASQHKIDSDLSKFPALAQTGFRILGMRVRD